MVSDAEDSAPTSIGEPWWSVHSEGAACEDLTIFDEYDDAEFGRATGGEKKGAPAGPLDDCRWVRPTEALGDDAALLVSPYTAFVIKPCRALDDRGVLAAIAVVSTRADLMLRLFTSTLYAAQGAYTISLYLGGAWTPVVVDTQLPISTDGDVLCAALSGGGASFAPALLEKAFAKLRGGYSRLRAESIDGALLALTGGSVERQVLNDEQIAAKVATGSLVNDTRAVDMAGDLLVLRMTERRAAALGLVGKATHGLTPGEYYVMLGFTLVGSVPFARVHSPWGSAPWNGPWGPFAAEWAAEPERASALRRERLHNENTSEWWLPASFLQLFDERVTCRLFRDVAFTSARADAWQVGSAGGAPTPTVFEGLEVLGAGDWATNPQFAIELADLKASSVELTVSLLCAPPATGTGEQWASVHVLRSDVRSRSWGIQPKALVASSGPHQGTELAVTFRAYARYAYTVVPSLLRPGQTGRFLLRAWCSRPFALRKTRALEVSIARGEWKGRSAGGPRTLQSWNANPQFWLSLPRRAFVLITLERTDDAANGRPRSAAAPPDGAAGARAPATSGGGSDDADGARALSGADGQTEGASDGVGVGFIVLRGETPVETRRKFLTARSASPGSPRSGSPPGALRPESAASSRFASSRPATATSARSSSPRSRRGLDPSIFSTAAVRDCSKLPHELKLKAALGEVVGEIRRPDGHSCSLLLNLDGDKPYVVVPSLEAARVDGSFTLTVHSAAGALLEPIPLDVRTIEHGRWTERTSCGCHLDVWSERQQKWLRNSRFLSNPQLQLRLDKAGSVRLRLQRGRLTPFGDESERADRSLLLRSTEKYYAAMLGLYVLRGRALGPGERLKLPARGYAGLDVVREAAFVPLETVELTLALKPLDGNAPYILVPCLFGEGLTGAFTLEVTSDAGARLSAVDDVQVHGQQPVAAAAGTAVV